MFWVHSPSKPFSTSLRISLHRQTIQEIGETLMFFAANGLGPPVKSPWKTTSYTKPENWRAPEILNLEIIIFIYF